MAHSRKLLVAGAVALALAGCDSSSSSSSGPSTRSAQAIDGFLVNSMVDCDGASGGTTEAAGRFECPTDTDLVTISGGIDVGFDETETENGEAFVGSLQAPGAQAYVTPLSTVAVAMASTDGTFNPDAFAESVQTLADALGVDSLDLDADVTQPANIAAARLNAQIQEVITGFAGTQEEYGAVMAAFATTLQNTAGTGETVNLTTDVADVLTAVNTQLATVNPEIALSQEDLQAIAVEIEETNTAIEQAEEPDGITDAGRQQPAANPVLTLNRNRVRVILETRDGTRSEYGLADFESNSRTGSGPFTVRVPGNLESIGYTRDALDVERSVNNTVVGLGFEIQAVDTADPRKLSLTVTGARVSMTQGDENSIVVRVPNGTAVNVLAVGSDGSSTDAQWLQDGTSVFSSSDNFVEVNLAEIQRRLEEKGIDGFLDDEGNYRVTVVISGLEIAQTGGNAPAALTVDSGDEAVSGQGFRGYASFID